MSLLGDRSARKKVLKDAAKIFVKVLFRHSSNEIEELSEKSQLGWPAAALRNCGTHPVAGRMFTSLPPGLPVRALQSSPISPRLDFIPMLTGSIRAENYWAGLAPKLRVFSPDHPLFEPRWHKIFLVLIELAGVNIKSDRPRCSLIAGLWWQWLTPNEM